MFSIKKKDGFKDERHLTLPIKNFPTYLTHPLVNHTYVTELGFYPSAKYHYRERFDGVSENILIYCLDGRGMIEIENESPVTLERGHIFCIPANAPHRYYSDELHPWSILWFHFNTPLSQHFPIIERTEILITTPEKSNLLQSHFIDLFTIAEKDYTLGNMICISKLMLTILTEVYLLEDGVSYDKQNRYLTTCIRYMNEHIHQDLTLGELAYELNISQSYLSSIFKKYTQKSPIDFLITLKIEQACKYMKMTDLKVYEIATKVGYQDPYYFSRIFKKHMGKSPKEYKKKLEKKFV
ncbi:AraC family transcriptional regulator [Carnobacterium gallinarum]|uniref:helix-turn-helix transcriptional regulator n=1 Tax=Carnobacterium gallinarum TaxID=2749 RepID=UPI0005599435|nr:AraC family transcriptional regulator [Carnobacterium gallinarum]